MHLKDKQIEAISSLLTDVIGASFAANVIHGSEVNSYWELHQTFFPHPIHGKKRSGHARLDRYGVPVPVCNIWAGMMYVYICTLVNVLATSWGLS